jgi:single-strand DNA-binding protein
MSKSINQVILMGNLTRDPELRTTPTGQSVCSFSLAVNRSWQGQDVTAWGKLGELVNQYMAKGRKCLVQGRLSQRSWEQEGQKRSKVEVVANDVTFLDGGGQGGDGGSAPRSSAPRSAGAKKDQAVEEIDDKPIDLSEIPF